MARSVIATGSVGHTGLHVINGVPDSSRRFTVPIVHGNIVDPVVERFNVAPSLSITATDRPNWSALEPEGGADVNPIEHFVPEPV